MSGDFPEVRYADAHGVSIAYSVRGGGPIDIVRVPGLLGSILASTVDPVIDAHYEHLGGFARLIQVDRRGLGMSDPLVAGGAPPLEQQVEDILAVMDTVGSRRVALYADVVAGTVALAFAAMHPERVSALVLNSAYARRSRAPDFPFGPPVGDYDRRREGVRLRWGDLDHPALLESASPSRAGDPHFRHMLARVQQVSASRAAAAAAMVVDTEHDVRAVLGLVQAPTLVLCPADRDIEGDDLEVLGKSQFLADHIPNARLALFPGSDIYFGVHTPEIGARIEEFLTGTRPAPASDRVLATVLFTDIVGSTEQLTELGDQAWRTRLDQHDAMVRTQLERFRGREINTTGDGFLATFDGPARGAMRPRAHKRCASARDRPTSRSTRRRMRSTRRRPRRNRGTHRRAGVRTRTSR